MNFQIAKQPIGWPLLRQNSLGCDTPGLHNLSKRLTIAIGHFQPGVRQQPRIVQTAQISGLKAQTFFVGETHQLNVKRQVFTPTLPLFDTSES